MDEETRKLLREAVSTMEKRYHIAALTQQTLAGINGQLEQISGYLKTLTFVIFIAGMFAIALMAKQFPWGDSPVTRWFLGLFSGS
jgi:hypothetical protein